jgi:hypothetical protein
MALFDILIFQYHPDKYLLLRVTPNTRFIKSTKNMNYYVPLTNRTLF